jgi:hypothetical protein
MDEKEIFTVFSRLCKRIGDRAGHRIEVRPNSPFGLRQWTALRCDNLPCRLVYVRSYDL